MLDTQLELYRLQTPDIIRVYDPQTQTFTRHFDRFQACTQEIIYDTTTGVVVGSGQSKILDIPLDPSKVSPELQSVVTQIVALVTQLHPLVAQAVTLQSANSVSNPEGMIGT